MTIGSAIFQGLLQGLTEFLPVSSSGHLSIYQYFTGINSEQSVIFSIMLHFGTLLAVFIAFWGTITKLFIEVFSIIGDFFTGKLKKRPPTEYRKMIYMLFISCVPLLAIIPIQDFIGGISADNGIITEGVCFLITATLLLLADSVVKGKKTATKMSVRDSATIGCAQLLATLPGVSRSGSTIASALVLGYKREYAVSYSFILGIPAIFAAGMLQVFDVLDDTSVLANFDWTAALIGTAVAAISGFFAIKMVTYVVKTNKFKYFSMYTLFLGLFVLFIGIIEAFTQNSIQNFFVAVLG